MPIIEPVIRPPAEADSLLLQVTMGCSANTCTFCGAYQHKPFCVKSFEEIQGDIDRAGKRYPDTRRIFLMDGDALVLSNEKLIPILDYCRDVFPYLARIATYANGHNIREKSDDELRELSRRKLTLIYMGLESGSQSILNDCKKKARVTEMVEGVRRAETCGIKSSVIVLLGLGGREKSAEHVRASIAALNTMQPRYLSFLTLMLIPGTPLHHAQRHGTFHELTAPELMQEAYDIIHGLELRKTIFRMNHASNYVPLEGRFSQDKEKLLRMIADSLDGTISFKPEFLRGL